MATDVLCQIDKHFAHVTDPRVDRGTNYDLVEMISSARPQNLWVFVVR